MHKNVSSLPTLCLLAVGASVSGYSLPAQAESQEASQGASLYERLGGQQGISQLVRDTIALHRNNPAIAHYFEKVDVEKLAANVEAFFAMGTGGPAHYEGRDMTSTHAGMGLTNADFDEAIADILRSMNKNRVDEREQAEVVAILQSLRPAVMANTNIAKAM